MCLLSPKRYWINGVVAIAAMLAGCATVSETVAPAVQPDTPDVEMAASDLPDAELDSALLYQLLLGEIAVQRGDFDTAAEALARAAEDSQDYRVAERATRVALRAKNFAQARQTAQIWAALRPEDTVPMEVIAMALVEAGRIDDAESAVEELLQRNSAQSDNVYRRLAELLSRQPNHTGALELSSRLAAQHPEDPEVYYAQAYLADRLHQPDLVVQAIDKALQLRPDWEDAALAKAAHLAGRQAPAAVVAEFCTQFLDDNPGAIRLRLYFARYLVDQDELEQALGQFVALIEQEPGNADGLYAAGLLALQLERLDEAESYLKRNLDLRPDNDQVRLYLGQVAVDRERYQEAEQWYKSVHGDAYYFDAQISISELLAETKGADAAMEHLHTLHPGDQQQYVRWVLTQEGMLRRDKQLQKAKEVLDTAVDRYPEDTELIYARGLLAAQLDLLTVHERDMRKLLVKDPTNAHALNALGYTLADATDRYEEAHNLIQQALSIRPEDPFILDSMGWVQYRMGNHADAIGYLERALSKRDDAEIAAHLGEVLWVNGDQDRAKQVWQRALEENPENDVLLDTLDKFIQ